MDTKLDEIEHKLKAEKLWETFNKSEKFGVQFGLIPALKVKQAIEFGYDVRLLTLALINEHHREFGG